MSVLIVNYHRTEVDPLRANGHVISDAAFNEQMNLIKQISAPVLSAAELCQPDSWGSFDQLAITFDDGFKSDLRNARTLAEMGLSATFFISTSNIGKPEYLDSQELIELKSLGMAIGSHSHEHRRMTKMRPVDIDSNIRKSKDILETLLNQEIDRFAFPGGAYTDLILEKLQISGFRFAFGTAWGSNDFGQSTDHLVFRRNNVFHQIPLTEFRDVIAQKYYRRRQVKYILRTIAFNMLPERAYGRLRQFLIART